MRMIAKALALAGTTGAALVAFAAPASADHQCPGTVGVCLRTDEVTIPAGTPAIGPHGVGPYVVPGPRLCDTSTGQCSQTVVRLPGAYVSAEGSTLSSVTIPSYGIEVGPGGATTLYYGVPALDPSSTGLPDFTIVAYVPYLPVGDESFQCRPSGGGGSDEPVTVELRADCYLVVTVQK